MVCVVEVDQAANKGNKPQQGHLAGARVRVRLDLDWCRLTFRKHGEGEHADMREEIDEKCLFSSICRAGFLCSGTIDCFFFAVLLFLFRLLLLLAFDVRQVLRL